MQLGADWGNLVKFGATWCNWCNLMQVGSTWYNLGQLGAD